MNVNGSTYILYGFLIKVRKIWGDLCKNLIFFVGERNI